MTKQISHYIARFDMPGWKKGEKVIGNAIAATFPDVFEPVYKETPIIPPGIVKFRTHYGTVIYHKDIPYDTWVRGNLSNEASSASIIHTISANGMEWTCEEKVKMGYDTFLIEGFEWNESGDAWAVRLKDLDEDDKVQPGLIWIGNITKFPIPICQLPDENGNMVDMYEGDTSYWVFLENFKIGKDLILDKWGTSYMFKHFATLAAAEKYVLDNQPFYPRGLVEAVIQARNSMDYSQLRVSEAIDNLEAFKETHLKDKV